MVIGGWTEPSDGRASIGALHVGFYEGERLVYAGKVGSGFTERLLSDLLERLQVRRRDSCPFEQVPAEFQRGAHGVEPGLVAQVEFTQWTDEGRMRQPVFLGLRDTLTPLGAEDVVAVAKTHSVFDDDLSLSSMQ